MVSSRVEGANSSGHDRRKVFVLLRESVGVEYLIVDVFLIRLGAREVAWFGESPENSQRNDRFVLDASDCFLRIDPGQVVEVNL